MDWSGGGETLKSAVFTREINVLYVYGGGYPGLFATCF